MALDTLESSPLVRTTFPGGIVRGLVTRETNRVGILRRQRLDAGTGRILARHLTFHVLLSACMARVALILQRPVVRSVHQVERLFVTDPTVLGPATLFLVSTAPPTGLSERNNAKAAPSCVVYPPHPVDSRLLWPEATGTRRAIAEAL